jgi:hypothetical protein
LSNFFKGYGVRKRVGIEIRRIERCRDKKMNRERRDRVREKRERKIYDYFRNI